MNIEAPRRFAYILSLCFLTLVPRAFGQDSCQSMSCKEFRNWVDSWQNHLVIDCIEIIEPVCNLEQFNLNGAATKRQIGKFKAKHLGFIQDINAKLGNDWKGVMVIDNIDIDELDVRYSPFTNNSISLNERIYHTGKLEIKSGRIGRLNSNLSYLGGVKIGRNAKIENTKDKKLYKTRSILGRKHLSNLNLSKSFLSLTKPRTVNSRYFRDIDLSYSYVTRVQDMSDFVFERVNLKGSSFWGKESAVLTSAPRNLKVSDFPILMKDDTLTEVDVKSLSTMEKLSLENRFFKEGLDFYAARQATTGNDTTKFSLAGSSFKGSVVRYANFAGMKGIDPVHSFAKTDLFMAKFCNDDFSQFIEKSSLVFKISLLGAEPVKSDRCSATSNNLDSKTLVALLSESIAKEIMIAYMEKVKGNSGDFGTIIDAIWSLGAVTDLITNLRDTNLAIETMTILARGWKPLYAQGETQIKGLDRLCNSFDSERNQDPWIKSFILNMAIWHGIAQKAKVEYVSLAKKPDDDLSLRDAIELRQELNQSWQANKCTADKVLTGTFFKAQIIKNSWNMLATDINLGISAAKHQYQPNQVSNFDLGPNIPVLFSFAISERCIESEDIATCSQDIVDRAKLINEDPALLSAIVRATVIGKFGGFYLKNISRSTEYLFNNDPFEGGFWDLTNNNVHNNRTEELKRLWKRWFYRSIESGFYKIGNEDYTDVIIDYGNRKSFIDLRDNLAKTDQDYIDFGPKLEIAFSKFFFELTNLPTEQGKVFPGNGFAIEQELNLKGTADLIKAQSMLKSFHFGPNSYSNSKYDYYDARLALAATVASLGGTFLFPQNILEKVAVDAGMEMPFYASSFLALEMRNFQQQETREAIYRNKVSHWLTQTFVYERKLGYLLEGKTSMREKLKFVERIIKTYPLADREEVYREADDFSPVSDNYKPIIMSWIKEFNDPNNPQIKLIDLLHYEKYAKLQNVDDGPRIKDTIRKEPESTVEYHESYEYRLAKMYTSNSVELKEYWCQFYDRPEDTIENSYFVDPSTKTAVHSFPRMPKLFCGDKKLSNKIMLSILSLLRVSQMQDDEVKDISTTDETFIRRSYALDLSWQSNDVKEQVLRMITLLLSDLDFEYKGNNENPQLPKQIDFFTTLMNDHLYGVDMDNAQQIDFINGLLPTNQFDKRDPLGVDFFESLFKTYMTGR